MSLCFLSVCCPVGHHIHLRNLGGNSGLCVPWRGRGPYLDSRSVNILIVKYCKPIFIRLQEISCEVRKGVIIANNKNA